MKMVRTVRNCLPTFRFVCPKRWEELAPGDDPAVRHCPQCDRDVHFCSTDEETIAHATAGHCIAREEPDDSEMPPIVIGQPSRPNPMSSRQRQAWQMKSRESGINDSIENVRRSSRHCPRCRYPAPDWRATCRVCGFPMGRVIDGSTQS